MCLLDRRKRYLKMGKGRNKRVLPTGALKAWRKGQGSMLKPKRVHLPSLNHFEFTL